MISISVIGAGQVGTQFCKAINATKNLHLEQWYNRSKIGLENSIDGVDFCNDLMQLKPADLYIIAVSDSAVEGISNALPFENRLVVHTSGSVALRFLNKKNRKGVFYPLQTFSKTSNLDFVNVPICIETTDKSDRKLLKSVADALGSPTYFIQSEQRQSLHLSAVFVNNFTNQLYRIAHELTDREGLEFDILKPLMHETIQKLQKLSPYMAQTGPAKRNDKKTIKQHLKLLEKTPKYQKIYELITQTIQQTHG
tara:strand:+ start:124 stop:882 length:759 start_codon:yes stop_codon:yes gene_type:complete